MKNYLPALTLFACLFLCACTQVKNESVLAETEKVETVEATCGCRPIPAHHICPENCETCCECGPGCQCHKGGGGGSERPNPDEFDKG
ncbi:MAG: hypothetical protein LUF04_05345 [Bacteroides sp.]|nr:hypothetical protein [Bacteroides sp.]MCD8079841.1 hypothetical protein [Bacteroides sp.]